MSRQMLQGETFFLLTADQIFYESINLPFESKFQFPKLSYHIIAVHEE